MKLCRVDSFLKGDMYKVDTNPKHLTINIGWFHCNLTYFLNPSTTSPTLLGLHTREVFDSDPSNSCPMYCLPTRRRSEVVTFSILWRNSLKITNIRSYTTAGGTSADIPALQLHNLVFQLLASTLDWRGINKKSQKLGTSCVCWSLWHTEQLLFSCLCSKVTNVKCQVLN